MPNQGGNKMEYITIIRNLRRIALMAFLMTIAFVIVFWAFVMTNAMEHFMWALPGFDLESTNTYVMWLTGGMEVAGILLFLIPAIVLSIEIWLQKPKSKPKKRK
jgi:predicted neutral ceramidase superfamily lipid hydrolase